MIREVHAGMNTLEMINPTEISVLLAGFLHHDEAALEQILSGSHWRLRKARTIAETELSQRCAPAAVILCEETLPDGDWRMLLEKICREPLPPRLIVLSPSADGRLESEVLHMGGYDVLRKPFHRREVVHAVKSAWLSWRLNQIERSAEAADEDSYLPPAA